MRKWGGRYIIKNSELVAKTLLTNKLSRSSVCTAGRGNALELRGPSVSRILSAGREGATSCSDEGGAGSLVDGLDIGEGGALEAVDLGELDSLFQELCCRGSLDLLLVQDCASDDLNTFCTSRVSASKLLVQL